MRLLFLRLLIVLLVLTLSAGAVLAQPPDDPMGPDDEHEGDPPEPPSQPELLGGPAAPMAGYMILWDDSHDSDGDELSGNYSLAAGALGLAGYTVNELDGTPGAITPAALAGYGVVVLVDMELALTADEVTALHDFVAAGGGLLTMSDNRAACNVGTYNDLLAQYGIHQSTTADATGFLMNNITPHPVTSGVSEVGGNALFQPKFGAFDAITAPAVGLIRDVNGIPVLAAYEGSRVVAITDSDLPTNAYLLLRNNAVLMANVVRWLAAVAPSVQVDPPEQAAQYSDSIQTVSITADDLDSPDLELHWLTPLPDNLAETGKTCTPVGNGVTCTWTVEGTLGVAAGDRTITLWVQDPDGRVSWGQFVIHVLPENATVTFAAANPKAVKTPGLTGNSGPFSLTAYVEETQPDLPDPGAAPGDISLAFPFMTLVPIGPGNPVLGLNCTRTTAGTGYDGVQTLTCNFDQVPVNGYYVRVTADLLNAHYTGQGESTLAVFVVVPSFVAGGNSFLWPGSGDFTDLGFSLHFHMFTNRVLGTVVVARHVPGQPNESIYLMQGYNIQGLAQGQSQDANGTFGWAVITGIGYWAAPQQWPQFGYTFVAYLEDHATPGPGVDLFWIEVRDPSGNLVDLMSMARMPRDNAVPILVGDLIVPHYP